MSYFFKKGSVVWFYGTRSLGVHNFEVLMALRLIVIMVLAFSVMGCGKYRQSVVVQEGKVDKNTLTHGMVQLTIEVGKTTQTNILEAFGAPNITTLDGSGEEVWTYQRAGRIVRSKKSARSFLFFFASSEGYAERRSSMMTLIIKFNKDKIVKDFQSRSSQF